MVHSVAHAVNIPVIGMGGIASANDALEFIMAGATAVQIGAATFSDYRTMGRCIEGLERYCIDNDIKSITELIGIV